jgi:hypothetical protein
LIGQNLESLALDFANLNGCFVPTYSNEDLERIAAVIGVGPLAVADCRKQFEAAAAWYRSDYSPCRVAPSIVKRQAKAIAAAAKRLLCHLEIYDYRKASEGPTDLALLEALAFADDDIEENVIRASERVVLLVKIFDGIDGAQELGRHAGAAADDAKQRARLTTVRGRRGNPPLRAWVAEMKPIYKKLTDKNPRISVDARGKPAGPFWRFLKAASLPLAIDGKKLASGVRDQTRARVKRNTVQK